MAADLAARLLEDFPLLFWSGQSTPTPSLSGYVTVAGEDYALHLRCPNGALDVHGAELRIDHPLSNLLSADVSMLQRRFEAQHARIDVYTLLLELRDCAERSADALATASDASRAVPGGVAPPPSEAAAVGVAPSSALLDGNFYRRLLNDIDAVGWHHVHRLDPSLTTLTLRIAADDGRTHLVGVKLSPEYPLRAPQCEAELPYDVELRPSPSPAAAGASDNDGGRSLGALSEIMRAYTAATSAMSALFDALDDLDEHCWVLEPECPSRADTHRKLALGRHGSLLLELDARRPRALPECSFFGSESAVGTLRARLDERFAQWDAAKLPRSNLETLLEIALPSRTRHKRRRHEGSGESVADKPRMDEDEEGDEEEEELSLECGICYSFRLEGSGVPDVVCEFQPCSKPFHRACLYEWLRCVPDSRKSFDTLFGQCPYCAKAIHVRG